MPQEDAESAYDAMSNPATESAVADPAPDTQAEPDQPNLGKPLQLEKPVKLLLQGLGLGLDPIARSIWNANIDENAARVANVLREHQAEEALAEFGIVLRRLPPRWDALLGLLSEGENVLSYRSQCVEASRRAQQSEQASGDVGDGGAPGPVGPVEGSNGAPTGN